MVLGCLMVYGALFAAGYWIYSRTGPAVVMTAVAVAAMVALTFAWKKLRMR